MRFARHIFNTFVKPRVAERNRGITAVKQFIDRFALFQPCERAVLPQNGRGVRKSAFKSVVSAHQRSVTKFESLVENLPEFLFVAAGRQRHVHEVYRDDALIESAVIFRFSVFVDVRSEETSATHAGVAMPLAVFIHLIFEHFLLGNIVRDHTFRRTLCRKNGEIPVFRILLDVIRL